VDVPAETFACKVGEAQPAAPEEISGRDAKQSIFEDVSRLPQTVLENPAKAGSVRLATTPTWPKPNRANSGS
jgi:hypothetical protein